MLKRFLTLPRLTIPGRFLSTPTSTINIVVLPDAVSMIISYGKPIGQCCRLHFTCPLGAPKANDINPLLIIGIKILIRSYKTLCIAIRPLIYLLATCVKPFDCMRLNVAVCLPVMACQLPWQNSVFFFRSNNNTVITIFTLSRCIHFNLELYISQMKMITLKNASSKTGIGQLHCIVPARRTQFCTRLLWNASPAPHSTSPAWPCCT